MPATPAGTDSVTALLATADGLLSANLGGPLTPAGRDRGAAYALRIALEAAVDTALTAREAGLDEVSTRAKLLCLRHYTAPDLARRVNALWSRLSAACKYHHDEMGPTPAQVRAWRAAVGEVVGELTTARGTTSLEFPQQKAGGHTPTKVNADAIRRGTPDGADKNRKVQTATDHT
ncbi:hypothetical protein PV343_05795 [Streptomyces sp. WI03-4A]|uniref:hypothetical protein n=1 Tax=Streptomyces sp. WI03-4A TaxID=3028706 RepID=UPI0029A0DE9E|nr:hypothetical protein [Streptomyces sp. WI03-4A]MDX2591789.1 hypothetical protein [Streptomyces sp. WI03-4A]